VILFSVMRARLKPGNGQLEARRRLRAVSNHTLGWYGTVDQNHREYKPRLEQVTFRRLTRFQQGERYIRSVWSHI
jgi:hypothetical protein